MDKRRPENSLELVEPLSKKAKVGGKYDQSWKQEYEKQFIGIHRSDKSSANAFCEFCSCHFSIRSGGAYDIKKHCATQKHINASKAPASTSSLTSFFKAKPVEDFGVIRAEVVFTKFLVEKNLPIAIADDAGDLFRSMFPSCEVAKKYGCGRTKTTAILHEMASEEKEETLKGIHSCGVFSLSTDGGNDSKEKLFPVIVQYADKDREEVVTEVVSVDSLSSSTATGKDIFNHVKKTLSDLNLDLKNCISFSADNASVMVGEKSGVSAFLHEENENITVVGCPCHRINLAALKAANILPHKLDQLLIDIYFFLDKSSKRVARLKELQETLGCGSHEVLKHVNTRWLSLGPCISRLLELWEPISALFLELSEETTSKSTSSKAQGIFKKLLSDEVKAYAIFLENVVKIFEDANALLQSSEPLIHKMSDIMKSIVHDLCLRFVKPSHLQDEDVLKINVNDSKNLLQYSEIDVGYKCRKLVEKELAEDDKKKFYKCVREYFQTAVVYLQKKCNIDSTPLIHASVANPDKKLVSTMASLEFFVERFPSLVPLEEGQCTDEAMDILFRQFRDWQSSPMPLLDGERVDKYWFRLSHMNTQTGSPRFSLLCHSMLGILSIFHSNAACERLFSLARRNRTDFRASMSNKLLESISICKAKWGHKSYKKPLSKELLVKAKSATAASLKKDYTCVIMYCT